MILVVLWLFTSAYAVPVGVYPSSSACAVAAVSMAQAWDGAKERPFLYRLGCIPTLQPGSIGPPPPERPGYES